MQRNGIFGIRFDADRPAPVRILGTCLDKDLHIMFLSKDIQVRVAVQALHKIGQIMRSDHSIDSSVSCLFH